MRKTVRNKIRKAVNLFRRFRGEDPEFIDKHYHPAPDVCMLIGFCDGVLYTTSREGKTERYIHKFTGRSRPLLVSSWDGKQLYFLGGAYDFTEEGIVDRK